MIPSCAEESEKTADRADFDGRDERGASLEVSSLAGSGFRETLTGESLGHSDRQDAYPTWRSSGSFTGQAGSLSHVTGRMPIPRCFDLPEFALLR